MMNRSDWQAVRDMMVAADRAKLGEPPTVDEIQAYERGELSPENAERVRQLLIAYPDLARAFATPFPPEDTDLPPGVVEQRWQTFLEAQGKKKDSTIVPFWRTVAGIAAVLAVVFGSMLWQAKRELLRPTTLAEPTILTPDGRRGVGEPAGATVTPTGDSLLLVISIVGPTDYDTYRLDLVRAESQKRLWSSEPMKTASSNSFRIAVPSRLLAPGMYQVHAYGVRGDAQEQVATYTIDVRRP